MSNYPPTPAFGGGFVMSRPPYPGPKPNGPIKPQPEQPTSAPNLTPRLARPVEMAPSVSNVGPHHANGNLLSVVEGVEGDREEGEVSDVEMENTKWPSERVVVRSDGQLSSKANGNTGKSNALNISEQSWNVNQPNHTSVPSHVNQQWSQHQLAYHENCHHPTFAASKTNRSSPGDTVVPNPTTHAPQQLEEMRKKAQAAVLNLLPLKMTFKDIVDAGIHPSVLRQVFERIGLPIPSEEVAAVTPAASTRLSSQSQDASAKLAQQERAKELEQEKGREREREKERERQRERERELEAKRLMLQERLRKQELILKEQEEQRKKCLERKLREEQDRKEQEERERKAREEVAAAARKKEQEERLQAEAARKKKEEDLEQVKAKQRILQQKFEEMRLPAKPPLPTISTTPFSSLPPRVTPASSLPPPPFTTATIAPRAPIMIPGLLLDTMDMGPRAPETPMTAPLSTTIAPAPIENAQNSALVAPQTEDIVMKEVPDNRSFTKKKRPVAADFDTEPNMKFQQPKRRFGSLKEGPFIFELTEDEDEDTEVDEPNINGSLKRQNSIRLPSQASKSPPGINGGAKPERNGKSPPARSLPAANGNTDAAKQLQDTEEKIRRLREEIQARQEKKRKPSATATPTGTGTPVRVSTPLEIPGLGTNSSLLLPLPSIQPPVPSPSKVTQLEKTTIEIPGLSAPSSIDTVPPSSSVETSAVETNSGIEANQSTIADKDTSMTEKPEILQPPAIVTNLVPSISQQKAGDESESQKMGEEAERLRKLRMLLLSRRKAMELRQAKASDIDTPRELTETPASPQVISEAQTAPAVTIAKVDNNSATLGNDGLVTTVASRQVKDDIPQGAGPEIVRDQSESLLDDQGPDAAQEASETIPIPEITANQTLSQSPRSIDQTMAEATTEGSESPPYEPFLENVRNDTESPPYEPSLGLEDGVDEDDEEKMEIDESDAEEGEILEESVDMEVDSGEDEVMQGSVVTACATSESKTPEPKEMKGMSWEIPGKDDSQPLISTTIRSTTMPSKPPSPILVTVPATLSEEQLDRPDPATANANDKSAPTAMPVSGTKVIPNVFTEYESPLRQFRSYRYHPQYLKMVEGGWRSLTFSNRIDPDKVFCVYEISGGKCNDPSCGKQHFRQIALSDDEILVELGSVMEGDTDAVRNSYRDGLRELITDMRARKVNDFETVAAEISLYRSRFFNDPSRVVRLTKGP